MVHLISAIKKYRSFFITYAILLVSGVIIWMNSEHGFLIHWWSEHRTDFWTFFFNWTNRLGEEWGYLLFGLILAVRIPYRALSVGLTGLAISIISQTLKWLFQQPRPSVFFGAEIENINVVEGWHIVGGINSLPSGHTAAAFALVSLCCCYLPKKDGLQILLVMLAASTANARIYGVNHFLIDVLFGSAVGVSTGFMMFYLTERLFPSSWKNFRWKEI